MSEDVSSNVIDFKSVKNAGGDIRNVIISGEEPQEVSDYLQNELKELGKLKAFFLVSIGDNGEIMCLKGSINTLYKNALIGATSRCLHDFITNINKE